MKFRVHFETLGCRLNQDETEGAAEAFRSEGFFCTMGGLSSSSQPDAETLLAVLNTCTVTGKAEQKARRIIRLMLSSFPNAVVIVTGCYASLDGEIIKSICPERIVVLGGNKKQLLSKIPPAVKKEGLTQKDVLDALRGLSEPSPFTLYTSTFQKHSRSSLKIQDGCNCSCSFCRICLARGRSVSLPWKEVVRRVQKLESLGMGEVVLTGVNLCQYEDFLEDGKRIRLTELLSLILKNTSTIRIRLSSLYPQSLNADMCAVLSHSRIQPFFHLSIQSGSPRILSLMNRPHSLEQVEEAVRLLRVAKEDPFISCDIIAGFPSETEEDFELTQKLCRKSDFAWIHAFPFSPRPGTRAKDMENQVPERIKDQRVEWLTKTAVDGKIAYIERHKGKVLSAVLENREKLCAVTENYLHVSCSVEEGIEVKRGSVCRVRIGDPLKKSIEGGREEDCTGTIVG